MVDLGDRRARLETLARAVGESLIEAGGVLRRALSSEGRDIKLAADLEAERVLIEGLAGISDEPILSEEAGWVGARAPAPDEAYWLIDPLDGSFNYNRGLPGCCISIAYCRGFEPLVGVTYDFYGREMFSAAKGQGATLNGERLVQVSIPRAKAESVLMTGFPLRADLNPDRLSRLGGDLAAWKKVRMIGSAGMSLAYVASGRADAYTENGISWWDVAAGLLLVQEAGGAVAVSGENVLAPVEVRACVAGLNPSVFDSH